MKSILKYQLSEVRELLKAIIGNYLGIDLYLYEGTIFPIINANYEFYASDDEIRLLSQELLQRKFTFDKKLKGEVNGSY